MHTLRIIALCVIVAVLYGVLHNQFTARICLEYFTVGHPRLAATDSPTIHALLWGVIATWWAGLLVGSTLALAARLGRKNRIAARELVRPVLMLLAATAAAASLAAAVGHQLAASGHIRLLDPLASRVPIDRHVAFLTALWAHTASYIAGFAGAVVLIVTVIFRRRRSRCCPASHGGCPPG